MRRLIELTLFALAMTVWMEVAVLVALILRPPARIVELACPANEHRADRGSACAQPEQWQVVRTSVRYN